jgi:hypothetical protein
MSLGLLNCTTGKALLDCATGKALLNCYGDCIDTIVIDHYVATTGVCLSAQSNVTIATGKSYPYPVRLKITGTGTLVDDYSTVNGTVWHSTSTMICWANYPGDPRYRTINAQTFTDGYILRANGTGAIITIPANTQIVFVIHDTMGVRRALQATFCVYYHTGTP